MKTRRIGAQRLFRIGDNRQRLVFDFDQRERFLGDFSRRAATSATPSPGNGPCPPRGSPGSSPRCRRPCCREYPAPSSTASTPGSCLAFAVSMRRMRACGYSERRTLPTKLMPGIVVGGELRPPVTLPERITRALLLPMMLCFAHELTIEN